MWEKILTDYVKRETNPNENFHKSYVFIFGYCTEHMRSKLEAHKYYQMIRGDYGMFLLMAVVKGITSFNFDRH